MESVQVKTHIIRKAVKKDVPEILEYIKTEWNEQHIFVTDPSFFEYEHCNGDEVNGIVAENMQTGKIEGILLMYPVRRKMIDTDFFGGIWSVSKSCKLPMLGIKMLENILKVTGAKSHSGVGINPATTGRIFRGIKEQRVDRLKHYYRLADREQYNVAYVEAKNILEVKEGEASFIKFEDVNELVSSFQLDKYKDLPFYKDAEYIKYRYFEHPIYSYNVIGIKLNDKINAVLIIRVLECNNAKIARVIDFLGEEGALKECGVAFQRMINENNLEYIDFYEYGLDDDVMKEAGFVLRTADDVNIIPNYFEPYLQKNIDIWFHTPYAECRIFKGDGDQDRPSRTN